MTNATVGELLYKSYANLAMAHAAVTANSVNYERTHFMIRARLLSGLKKGTMNVGSLIEDERLKMVLPQACCYCGCPDNLSVDHLLPTKRGGPDTGDNLVWACRTCNSSKGAKDVLAWWAERGEFPPLLLLRRYLKLAIETCRDRGIMDVPLEGAPELPISLSAVPQDYPKPSSLRLWVVPLSGRDPRPDTSPDGVG